MNNRMSFVFSHNNVVRISYQENIVLTLRIPTESVNGSIRTHKPANFIRQQLVCIMFTKYENTFMSIQLKCVKTTFEMIKTCL